LYINKPAGHIIVSASLSQTNNEDDEQWPEVVEEFVVSPRINSKKTNLPQSLL